VEQLKTRIEKTLKEQEEHADRERRERELFDAIRNATVLDLAPELISSEERALFDEIARNLEREKKSLEEWLKQTNRTVEALQKEMQEEAGKRLTLRFAIQWLMEDRKIEMSAEDVAGVLKAMLDSLPENQRKEAEAYYKVGGDGYEELKWRQKVEKLVKGMLET